MRLVPSQKIMTGICRDQSFFCPNQFSFAGYSFNLYAGFMWLSIA